MTGKVKQTKSKRLTTPLKPTFNIDFQLKKYLQLKYLVPVFIFFIIFIVYIPSLPNQFVWDDHYRIDENTDLYNISNITSLVNPKTYVSVSTEPSYRPFVVLTRFFDCAIWKHWATGHRLDNILTHILVTLLFYGFCLYFIKNQWAAALAALFFGLHPIQTEPVAIIAFRADIQAALFLLVALGFYIQYRKNLRSWLWLAGSLVSYLLAMLSKETAITLPLILLVFDYFILRENNDAKFKKPVYWHYLAFVTVTAVYLLLRFRIFLTTEDKYLKTSFHQNPFEIIQSTSRLFMLYITKFFWPLHLTVAVPFNRSQGFDPASIFGFLFVILFVFLILYFYRKNRMAMFGMFWFGVIILPLLQIVPLGNPFAERWLYIPSLGLAFTIGSLIKQFLESNQAKQFQKYFIAMIIIVLVFFGIRTSVRCMDFNNDITMWYSALKETPKNPDLIQSVGNMYLAKDNTKAIKYFRMAYAIQPNDPNLFAGMAQAYFGLKDYLHAAAFAKMALIANQSISKPSNDSRILSPEIITTLNEQLCLSYFQNGQIDLAIAQGKYTAKKSSSAPLHFCLGQAYEQKGQYLDALVHYIIGLKNTKTKKPAQYLVISKMYQKLGHPFSAIPTMEEAYMSFPNDIGIKTELVRLFRLAGRPDLVNRLVGRTIDINVPQLIAWGRSQKTSIPANPSAEIINIMEQVKPLEAQNLWNDCIPLLESALKINNQWDQLYLELGVAYTKVNDYSKAVNYWVDGVKINPQNPYFFVNLGYYYNLNGNPGYAKLLWERALELNPNLPDIRNNLEMLKSKAQ